MPGDRHPEARTFGPGRTVGEAVSCPDRRQPRTTAGTWPSCDAATDRSDLVVIAGQDWLGEPVAIVHLPVRTLGFHGTCGGRTGNEPPPAHHDDLHDLADLPDLVPAPPGPANSATPATEIGCPYSPGE
jgi:hypothetical protein